MLKDDLHLPDKEEMLHEIALMKSWKRAIMPEQPSRGSLLQLHTLHYHDELLRDLDISCRRKKNAISELFGAYLPADYKEILSVYLRKKALPRSTGSADDRLTDIDISAEDLSCADLRHSHLDNVDLSG